MGDRKVGEQVKIRIMDREFKKLPVQRVGDLDFEEATKPINYQEMLKIAELLSEDFPHVRVDLYNIDGEVYFGEITFFPSGGNDVIKPEEWSLRMGEWIDISKI